MKLRLPFLVATLALFAAVAGCGGSEPDKPADKSPPASSSPAKAPLIPVKKAADWCGEHGVPESMCTKCNKDLVAEFQKKGDWCKEHGVPESQCFECKPELRAKFEAMAPK